MIYDQASYNYRYIWDWPGALSSTACHHQAATMSSGAAGRCGQTPQMHGGAGGGGRTTPAQDPPGPRAGLGRAPGHPAAGGPPHGGAERQPYGRRSGHVCPRHPATAEALYCPPLYPPVDRRSDWPEERTQRPRAVGRSAGGLQSCPRVDRNRHRRRGPIRLGVALVPRGRPAGHAPARGALAVNLLPTRRDVRPLHHWRPDVRNRPGSRADRARPDPGLGMAPAGGPQTAAVPDRP
jgi:hypothetical protein